MAAMGHHQSRKRDRLEGKAAKRRRKNALFRVRRIGPRSHCVKTSLAQGGRALGEVVVENGHIMVLLWHGPDTGHQRCKSCGPDCAAMWFSCSGVRSIHIVQSHAALIEKCGDQRHRGFRVCQARIEGDAIPCAEVFRESGRFFDTLKTLAIDEK